MIEKKDAENKTEEKGWFFYAVLSAVFASLTSILGKIGIVGVESNLGTAIRTVVVIVMSFVMVAVNGKVKEIGKVDKKELMFILLSGISTGASWLFYYRALQDGEASIVVPIDKLSILVTIAFSYFVFKEKLSKKALIGLVLIVGGTFALLVK
ncbi:MAG: EamA family transporter [Spirochaetales bacterium]|nr:EamA family transporter [Spirochaetales bacterium]